MFEAYISLSINILDIFVTSSFVNCLSNVFFLLDFATYIDHSRRIGSATFSRLKALRWFSLHGWPSPPGSVCRPPDEKNHRPEELWHKGTWTPIGQPSAPTVASRAHLLNKVNRETVLQNILIPVANVSRDWIVFEESLVFRGLLGHRQHSGRVSRHVPDCRVARGRVQPGWVVRRRGWEGVGRAHEHIETGKG